MPSAVRLDLSNSATLDSNGKGIVQLSAAGSGEKWNVDTVTVTSNSALATKFALYKDHITAASVLLTSESGNNDTATGVDIDVSFGQSLYGVWMEGTPGASVRLDIRGDRTIGGRIY